MSLPKAQLVDPQGNMNLPGMTATGIVTASSLKGVTAGSATGLTGNPDLDVGIVTASSFVGQGDGHAANLTGTPQLNLGVTTSTGFIGDAVGKAAGLTGTPNLNVGLITATSFVGFVTGDVTGNITGDVTGNITGNIQGDVEGNVTGNVSGLARGLGINGTNVWTGAGTSNLGVGVCTATLLYGDGSGLVGAGSSAYIAQNITVSGSETIIDLSYGNLIYFDQADTPTTTVGFASTSAAEQITFIRTVAPYTESWNISYATGGVTFDGGTDALYMAADSDFDFGTGAYTIEFWIKTSTDEGWVFFNSVSPNWTGLRFRVNEGVMEFNEQVSNGDDTTAGTTSVDDGVWHHVALCRGASGDKTKLYVDGSLDATGSANRNFDNNNTVYIGKRASQAADLNGILSNYRIVKGSAVYTKDFVPPTSALTNITGTVFLALQSTTDDTAYTVSPGTITAVSDPVPGAQTITNTGTLTVSDYTITWPDRVKWNGGTAPTLINSDFPSSLQLFRFTTVDTGLNYNAWEEMEEDSNNYNMFGTNKIGTRWLNTVGGITKYSSPVQVEGNNFRSLLGDSGSEAVFAFKNDGTLWGGGQGDYGVLGENSTTFRSSPIQIPGTTWNKGGTNGYTTMATKTDNTLWVWGWNYVGALGQNQAHDTGNVSSPVQMGTGTDWKELSVGGSVQGFKTDGTLWVWGGNEHGKLGLNSSNDNARKSSPTQIPGTTWNFGAVSTRNQAAIKTDGTLWIWGTNENGQLGQNTNGTPSGSLDGRSSPAQVGTDTTWANIVWTQYTAYAVKTDASLWQWGQDLYATNDTVHRSSPTQIPGTWSVNLSASRYTAGCVKTDGTLWAWGRAYNGIFAQNLDQDGGLFYSSPIQVGNTTGWSQERNGLAVSNDMVTGLKKF